MASLLPALLISRQIIFMEAGASDGKGALIEAHLEEARRHNMAQLAMAPRLRDKHIAETQDLGQRLRECEAQSEAGTAALRARIGLQSSRLEAILAKNDQLEAEQHRLKAECAGLRAGAQAHEQQLHEAVDTLELLEAQNHELEARVEALRGSHAKRTQALGRELHVLKEQLALAGQCQGGNGGSLECIDPPAPLKGHGPEARAVNAELEFKDEVMAFPSTPTTPLTPAASCCGLGATDAAAAKIEKSGLAHHGEIGATSETNLTSSKAYSEAINAATGRMSASTPEGQTTDHSGDAPDLLTSTVNAADEKCYEGTGFTFIGGHSFPDCPLEGDLDRLQAKAQEMEAANRLMQRHGMTPAVKRKLRKLGFKV